MRIVSFLGLSGLVLLFAATVASAHPQTSYDVLIKDSPSGQPVGIYIWNYLGQTSIWNESNGKTDNGMYGSPNGGPNATGTAVLGLQIHDVCYGTFTQAQVDCLNSHHGNKLFTYVPWVKWNQPTAKFVARTKAECDAMGGEFVSRDELLFGQVDDALYHGTTPVTACVPE